MMKQISFLSTVIILIITVLSCSTNSSSDNSDKNTNEKKSELFLSDDGSFEIDFPSKPKKKERVDGEIKMTAYTAKKNKIEYNVSYTDYPQKYLEGKDTIAILEGSAKAGLGLFEIEKTEHLKVGGHEAIRSYAYDKRNNDYYIHQTMLVGNREYVILMIKTGKYPGKKDISRFFDSFSIKK